MIEFDIQWIIGVLWTCAAVSIKFDHVLTIETKLVNYYSDIQAIYNS